MALQHVVLFSFPRPLSADEEAEMRAMVASWPDKIGLMDKCRFGTDLTGQRTRGYTQLLYTEFADVANATGGSSRREQHGADRLAGQR